MEMATNTPSVLRQCGSITSYTASLFCLSVAVLGAVSNAYTVLFDQTNDWTRTSDIFLTLVVFALVIPFVWITTYAVAFLPALFAVGTDQLLRRRQFASERLRHAIIYALTIGFSLPISAVVYSLSFDGWPIVWPVTITAVVLISSHQLISIHGNSDQAALSS
jgi:hypothetical protein